MIKITYIICTYVYTYIRKYITTEVINTCMCTLLHLYVSADKNCLDILYLYYQDVKTKWYGHARSCTMSHCQIWTLAYTVYCMEGNFGDGKTYLAKDFPCSSIANIGSLRCSLLIFPHQTLCYTVTYYEQ